MASTEGAFPDNSLFRRLFLVAESRPDGVIADPQHGNISYAQLLRDVEHFRNQLRQSLSPSLFTDAGIIREEDVYICTFMKSSYEMIVALFSIISIGAAMIPLSPDLMPAEVMDFYSRFNAKGIITHSSAFELGNQIDMHNQETKCIPLLLPMVKVRPEAIQAMAEPYIDPAITIPPNRPVISLFSSGTTGPPKGIIHALRFFTAHMGPLNPESGTVLIHGPMHYCTCLKSVVNAILRGMRLEILEPNAGAAQIWERLRQGGVTDLEGSVSFWVNLMEYFQQNLDNLPEIQKKVYIDNVRLLRVANCTGAMAMPTTKRFWKSMRGRPLQMAWGSTECARGLTTGCDSDFIDTNAIGRPVSNVEVKLSEGDHGEMRVKTPTMFLRYWNNEAATRAAFDEDGFYRTGDLVYRSGDDYVIQGRAATDFINCDGAKTPILDVETALSRLHYITEAAVLPVIDPKRGNRVAALVRVRSDQTQLTLQALREDLASYLPAFQLPTVLRVLSDQEEFPRTVSGKLARQEAKDRYFPQKGTDPSLQDLPQDVQVDNFDPAIGARSRRMWDTGGVQ